MGKPGAWALDSEEQQATMAMEEHHQHHEDSAAAAGYFPSLSAAAAKKTSKKKKQTFSLAEFSSGAAEKKLHPYRSSNETLVLPTGPRERSAEELECSRGFGYSSPGPRGRAARESRVSVEPRREPRDSEPSRADEVENWGASKRSVVSERRERERGGGFFDSQSRADESDSWISRKPVGPSNRGRVGRDGLDTLSRVDSDTWGKKREEAGTGGDVTRFAT